MTNLQLENELKTLVTQEKHLLHEILLRIQEVDKRNLYLDRGFGSLFEYLTIEIGYSGASAQRRIDAVRLSHEIPEVIAQVREGQLNLSQIGQAQKGFRRKDTSSEEKRSLLGKLAGAPSSQAEAIVARELELPIEVKTKLKPQADGSVRLEVTLSGEGHRNLIQVKELLSHSIPGGELSAVLEKALAFYLEKKSTIAAVVNRKSPPAKPAPKSTTAAVVKPKAIPAETRRQIFRRDECCQFRAANGKLCGSRHQLEIDHIQLRFHGGTNEPENLRLLCRKHNSWVAEQTMLGKAAR